MPPAAKQFLDLLPSKGLGLPGARPRELADLPGLIARQPLPEDLPGLLAELCAPAPCNCSPATVSSSPATSTWLALAAQHPFSTRPRRHALDRWTPGNAVADLPLGARLLGIKRRFSRKPSPPPQPTPQPGGQRLPGGHLQALSEELPDPIDPSELGLNSGSLQPPALRERGNTPLDSALICLKRLANRYRFPFPRDTIEQVLLDCDSRLGGISLLHLGQILESLDLDVRPLAAKASQLHRLQPPALIRLKDRLLVEEAGPRGLTVAIAASWSSARQTCRTSAPTASS